MSKRNSKIDYLRGIAILLVVLGHTISGIVVDYENSILYYSKSKGGLFIHLKFNNEVDTNIFENGSNYYIDENHNNETRINICNLLNKD